MAEEQIGIDLVINAAESANSVAELKKSITDLQSAAIAAGNAGDDALANKYIAAAGAARDKIGDLNEAINATKGAADKLGAITNIGQSIAGGFAAAQGAAALFGASQEDVQQQLLKVQAATALLSGVQSAANIKEQLEVASIIAQQTIRTVQTNLQTTAEEGGTAARIAATVAQKALNLAMSANPIAVMIIAITALVAALNSLGDTSEETANKMVDANKKVMASMDERREHDVAVLKALGKDTIDIEIENERNRIAQLQKEKERIQQDENLDDEKRKERLAEINADWSAAIDNLDILRASARKKEIEDEKKQAEENQKLAEDAIKSEQDKNERQNELHQQYLDALQKHYDDIQNTALEHIAILEQYEQDKLAQQQADADAQLAIEEESIDRAFNSFVIDKQNRKILAEKELAEEQARTQAKISMAESALKGATALAQIIFKDSEKLAKFNKDAALVQIGIDTAKAISGVVAAASSTSITPVDLAAKIVAGTAVVIANIAKAKQLLDTKGAATPSLGGGAPPATTLPPIRTAESPTVPLIQRPAPAPRTTSTGGGTANSPQIPNKADCDCGPKVGSGSTQLDEDGNPIQTIRAYVVETEVTSKQNNIRQIKERNTF